MRQHPSTLGGGLLIVAGFITACGGGGAAMPSAPTGAGAPPAGTAAIAITANDGPQSFNPNPATARVGQMVVWQNRDGVAHHIVQDSDAGSAGDPGGYGSAGSTSGGFDVGQTAPGATSMGLNVTTAGVIHYHCSIHPGMVGTLTVTQ